MGLPGSAVKKEVILISVVGEEGLNNSEDISSTKSGEGGESTCS